MQDLATIMDRIKAQMGRFVTEYLETETGRKHYGSYLDQMRVAKDHWLELVRRRAAGEDTTELVLLWLLPYADTAANRARDAWVSTAPTFAGEVQKKYEGIGWVRPGDWKRVADTLFEFVRRCIEDPTGLQEHCDWFSDVPDLKGFQSGTLSPILHALAPEHFCIVNNKTFRTLADLTGEHFHQPVLHYPHTNSTLLAICSKLDENLGLPAYAGRPADLFDTFTHWYVALREKREKAMPTRALEEEVIYRTGVGAASGGARYYKISPGHSAKEWQRWLAQGIASVGWTELGDVSGLDAKAFEVRLHDALAEHPDWGRVGPRQVWNFSRIRPGDRFVANRGKYEVLGVGTVTRGYQFFDERHGHRLGVEWTPVSPAIAVDEDGWMRTLLELSEEKFEDIATRIESAEFDSELNLTYSLADCARDTGLGEERLARWMRAIGRKGQAILYGPPGTGKTHVARHLARVLVGGGAGFIELLQFHPGYTYEDFVQGLRPVMMEGGQLQYRMEPGRFLQFCERASQTTDPCVLILDEINRANLARVFGELMFLLEYRDQHIPLSGGKTLAIPENVVLLGTMNTADRSIALVDHALRRRFVFLQLEPDYELLRSHLRAKGWSPDDLVSVLREINEAIANPSFSVGISYFLGPDLPTHLEDIWHMELETYLEEYFFDRPDLVDRFRWEKLRLAL
ncbi:AAA family ATPase [Myxococcota bacterium]|nr:AAA family ATPase [Myxococcota bacterium]MBU1412001.1 AAA family ATPase [Myxococcota bacterium]MBU1509963.1 AAA family ATPase [Myxococcota bacterium]